MLNTRSMFTYDERQELVFTLILSSAGSWYLLIGLQSIMLSILYFTKEIELSMISSMILSNLYFTKEIELSMISSMILFHNRHRIINDIINNIVKFIELCTLLPVVEH